MKQKLLLIEDVEDLGKSGEIVSVKPGYARNFLLPRRKALIAKKHTLRLQKKLQEEREKRAAVEKREAEELAALIGEKVLSIDVKVDPEGRMYGSVSSQDIVALLEKEGIKIDRKNVILKHPIKETGVFDITFKLKEGVEADCKLKIIGEGAKKKEVLKISKEEVVKEEVKGKEEKKTRKKAEKVEEKKEKLEKKEIPESEEE
jgi:large subunit ribosomal protein L9